MGRLAATRQNRRKETSRQEDVAGIPKFVLCYDFGEMLKCYVLTALNFKILVFWDATFILVDSYQRFGRTCYLHLESRIMHSIYQTVRHLIPEKS
jgi:hypothetical protein